MKSLLLSSITLLATFAFAESELILRDCSNEIRRTVSNIEDSFTVTLKLVSPNDEQLTAKSKNGETLTAQIKDGVAIFSSLSAGDWSFCSEKIQSISYTTNSDDNLLLAGITGAGALAGVVSFSGSSGGENSINSTENLSLEGGSGSGDASSQTPSTAGSSAGDSSADFARECLNEEEIDVLSRMN